MRSAQRGHEQQAAAAEEAFRHLQEGYQQAATPVLADLTRRAPRAATARRFEQDVREALPNHADRILADPTWTALTTTLARAETAGHNPRRLLAEVGTQRELDSAEHPAEVLKHDQRNVAHVRHATPSGHTSGHEARRAQSTPLTPSDALLRARVLITP